MARLFFAVWPDAEAAAALAELSRRIAEESRGRPVPAEKLHLTLAFLGETPPDRETLAMEAAELRARAISGEFDHVGAFRRAGVAWAGMSVLPPALLRLQRRLTAELRARDFALEEREFTPHLTLARRTQKTIARAPIAPIAWRCDELTLVRSESGSGRYTIVERWGLSP